MKRIFSALSIVALGIICLAGMNALGMFTIPNADATVLQTRPQLPHWEKLAVVDGGALTSPVLDFRNCDRVSVAVDNSSLTTPARTLLSKWVASDGTTVLYQTSTALPDASYTMVSIADTISAATAAAGETAVPAAPGEFMIFSIAAAANGMTSIRVTCR